MKSSQPSSEKAKILAALKSAHDRTLQQQDILRERLELLRKTGTPDYRDRLLDKGGWSWLIEQMRDENYPPTHQDRKKLLDQDWDEIPSRLKLETIEDFDIRASTYFLGEVVEQTQRISAITRFREILGANPDDPLTSQLFHCWERHCVYKQFAEERLAEGTEGDARIKRVLADTMGLLFDHLAGGGTISEAICDVERLLNAAENIAEDTVESSTSY